MTDRRDGRGDTDQHEAVLERVRVPLEQALCRASY